jgi:hypothetical protein
MCPLLAPAFQGLASSFFVVVAAAINSTNEANKAGSMHRLAVYIFLDVYGGCLLQKNIATLNNLT